MILNALHSSNRFPIFYVSFKEITNKNEGCGISMFKKAMTVMFVASLSIGVLSACSQKSGQADASAAASSSQTIKITMNEFSFSQNEITVKKGEKVHFVLTNSGNYPHDMNAKEISLDKDVDPGKTEEFDWTAPDKAGTYKVICDKPGHMEKGMTMTMTIN
jgi:uncharacterized cupredoxin-like copper-binding protein